MNDLVKIHQGKMTVTSKEIADNFAKVHRNITRDIETLTCSDKFRALNFEQSYYMSEQNKKLKCYNITRDGFSFLCMGFTGKRASQWKESYIEAFNKMESFIKTDESDFGLMESINILSLQLDNLAAAGSAWGKTGIEIRRRKTEATIELTELIQKAQMQLSFN